MIKTETVKLRCTKQQKEFLESCKNGDCNSISEALRLCIDYTMNQYNNAESNYIQTKQKVSFNIK